MSVSTNDVTQELTPRSARGGVRVYADKRTWADRLKNMEENWRPLLPLIVKAYKEWQAGGPASADAEGDVPMVARVDQFRAVDFYTLANTVDIRIREDQHSAEAMAAAGYLPNTPVNPSIAISFQTLELLRCLRLFKASFSTEAFAKLLCHKYMVCIVVT